MRNLAKFYLGLLCTLMMSDCVGMSMDAGGTSQGAGNNVGLSIPVCD